MLSSWQSAGTASDRPVARKDLNTVSFCPPSQYLNEGIMRNAMSSLKMQIMGTIATLMTAAFGLIAALAWNEAIKELIAQFFTAGDALMGLFVYAILVTIIAVVAGLLISRSLAKLKVIETTKSEWAI